MSTDYSIQELSAVLARFCLEAEREKTTGQIVLTLHIRNGGVGRLDVDRRLTFQRATEKTQKTP